jgi:hypothetical protein
MADMAKKQKKLGKLKMPEKRGNEMELDDLGPEEMMEHEMAEGEGEEGLESPEFQAKEEEYGTEMHGEGAPGLERVSDDELLAELKKRGLSAKLEEEEGEEEKDYGLA